MPQSDFTDLFPAADPRQFPYAFLSGQRPDGSKRAVLPRGLGYLGSLRYARQEMVHPIRELSGGQKAKLLLAKMVLEGTNVMLLDEPTRNFSPMSGPRVRQALRDYGGTIISVSHDRKFLAEVCDKLYCLTEDGLFPMDREALSQGRFEKIQEK